MTDKIDAAVERIRQQIHDQPRTPPHADAHRCYRCEDTGWVTRIDTGAVRPCATCNPVGFRRWTEGHYRFGHSCAECSAVASGSLKVGRDIDPSTGDLYPGALA